MCITFATNDLMSLASLSNVRVSLLTRYLCIQFNYKLHFRVDIALDSISNIPGVAELVDVPDSRSGAARRAGSSPVPGSF